MKWRPTKYPGYFVSAEGHVKGPNKRNQSAIILRPEISNRGYHRITVMANGCRVRVRVHRLMVETFHGPIPAGMQVNHIDRNKLNNSIDNLEVCTNRENMDHYLRSRP